MKAVPEFMGTKMKEQPLPGTGDNRPDLTIISPCGRKVMLGGFLSVRGVTNGAGGCGCSQSDKVRAPEATTAPELLGGHHPPFHRGKLGQLVPGKRQGALSPTDWLQVCSTNAAPLCGVCHSGVTDHMVPGHLQEPPQASCYT